jgi:predicted dinucleotide-binding enzyme
MKPRIGIIGNGNVGCAIERGLTRCGYEVKSIGNQPAQVREVAHWGQVIILAVPYKAIDDVIQLIGDSINNKPVIDVTNVLNDNFEMALGFTTSGAEELQKKLPKSKVIKAFNYMFAEFMDKGRFNETPISFFVAGDDQKSKEQIMEMGRDIGFDPIDAGPLQSARQLESLGYFNIVLGFKQNMGRHIAFRLIR